MKRVLVLFLLMLMGCDDAGDPEATEGEESAAESAGSETGAESSDPESSDPESSDPESSDPGLPLLEPGFESGFVTMGGCADLALYAGSEDQNTGIYFYAAGYAQQAADAGSETTVELDLATEASVEVHVGTLVSVGYCVDVPLPDGSIHHTYVATQGKATLTVTPDLEGGLAGQPFGHGKVVLEDVILMLEGADPEQTLEMGTVSLEGNVGLFPG
jgi:hypothetical protein